MGFRPSHQRSSTPFRLTAWGSSLTAIALLASCSSKSAPPETSASTSTSPDGGRKPPAFTASELGSQHCDLSRTATAYTAGAAASTDGTVQDGAPTVVSCLTMTDIGTGEPTLAVMKDGAVFYAPSYDTNGVGVLTSTDYGATWTPILPTFDGGSHGRVQPYLYADPTTDRIFFATTTLKAPGPARSGFDVSISADGGKTWTYRDVAPDTSDWIKFLAGPPVTSTTSDPNVLYASAPSPISTPSPDHQAIYKSLDGGGTWASVASISLKPADHPECASKDWIIFGDGAVAKDGTVYLGLRLCTHFAVAVSRDEGQTWSLKVVPGGDLIPWDPIAQLAKIVTQPNILVTEPVAVDTDGTLYAVWPDPSGLLRYSVSKDHAETWSAPLVVSAPAVTGAVYGNVAAQGPGTIAIAYYGSSDGQTYDGYIAESTNALDAAPTFQTLSVNDTSNPLSEQGFDSGYTSILTNKGDLNEIVEVRYAPNGDIWASFVKRMCPGLGNTSTCASGWGDPSTHANSVYQGAIGRLVHR
jgi:hypothetical protein